MPTPLLKIPEPTHNGQALFLNNLNQAKYNHLWQTVSTVSGLNWHCAPGVVTKASSPGVQLLKRCVGLQSSYTFVRPSVFICKTDGWTGFPVRPLSALKSVIPKCTLHTWQNPARINRFVKKKNLSLKRLNAKCNFLGGNGRYWIKHHSCCQIPSTALSAVKVAWFLQITSAREAVNDPANFKKKNWIYSEWD